MGWMGSGSDTEIELLSAYKVGNLRKHYQRKPRDIIACKVSWLADEVDCIDDFSGKS